MENSLSLRPDPVPLFIAINETSGSDVANLPENIRKTLQKAGHTVTIFNIPKDIPLKESCRELVKNAAAKNGIAVAAGGDGTVNGIASLCHEYGATIGIIPLGTFNYFARALDIPLELDKALELFRTGSARKVSAGFVHEHLFLNNASFGLYSKIIRKREEATKRFGRKRLVALVSALHSLFEKQKIFTIRLNMDGRTEAHRTAMIFVGNNSLQLENFGLKAEEYARHNKLAVVILKPLSRPETARLVWHGIVKSLDSESKLKQFSADSFEVESSRSRINIVIDGELIQCDTPLAFRVERDALNIIVPSASGEGA
jgi:diacylglycerol kinase family enzyme